MRPHARFNLARFLVFLGTEWVDPEDPTVIAENELLGAAAAIEAAAKKLEQLKPRAKPKVGGAEPWLTPVLSLGWAGALLPVLQPGLKPHLTAGPSYCTPTSPAGPSLGSPRPPAPHSP